MKKKIVIGIIIIVLIVSTIFVILKKNISQKNISEDTSILVERSFRNSAWSYTYRGTIICNNGEIYTFDLEKDANITPNDDNFIKSKYVQKTEKVVSPEDLQDMKLYISEINANYSSRSRGADMGSDAVYVYKNNESQKITLEAFGDVVVTNTSENSQELLSLIEKYIPNKSSIYKKLQH